MSKQERCPTGWVSVSERLPEDDRDVLWFVLDDWEESTNFIAIGSKSTYADNLEQVSHWMPLPSAPSSVAEQGQPKRHVCPSCKAADNNGYINAEGIRMRACDRCMIQWRDECCQAEQPSREQATSSGEDGSTGIRPLSTGSVECSPDSAVEGLVRAARLALGQLLYLQRSSENLPSTQNTITEVEAALAHYEASRGGKQ